MSGCTTFMNRFGRFVPVGLFLLSLGFVGYGGVGWASNATGALQIEHDRVSGAVTQVPLRIILDQFHTQLGIEYQGAPEELNKPVSVHLHQASLQQALEKILATWDYAVTKDQEGHIQHVFVLRKILAGGSEEQTIKAEASQGGLSSSRRGQKMGGASLDEQPVATWDVPTPSASAQREQERPRTPMEGSGLAMNPPSGSPEMPIASMSDAEQQDVLQVLESSDTDFSDPDGEITQMSEAEQQDVLQALESSDTEFFDPEREITQMSEAEQRAIVQLLSASDQ